MITLVLLVSWSFRRLVATGPGRRRLEPSASALAATGTSAAVATAGTAAVTTAAGTSAAVAATGTASVAAAAAGTSAAVAAAATGASAAVTSAVAAAAAPAAVGSASRTSLSFEQAAVGLDLVLQSGLNVQELLVLGVLALGLSPNLLQLFLQGGDLALDLGELHAVATFCFCQGGFQRLFLKRRFLLSSVKHGNFFSKTLLQKGSG